MVRGIPGGRARRMLQRPEFDGDVLLGLHRHLVHKSGLVTPQANCADGSGKKRERAADAFYIQHLAEFSNGGADLHGFRPCMAIPLPGIPGPNEGDQLTGLQASGLTRPCTSALRGNKN